MQDEEGRHMQTAGMFEMTGSQNGQEIFVRDDKNIQVNMASYEKGDDYDFFRLDQKKCNWNKKGTAKPKINKEKINGLAELKKNKVVPPVRPSKRGETDNFVFALDVNGSVILDDKYYRIIPAHGFKETIATDSEVPIVKGSSINSISQNFYLWDDYILRDILKITRVYLQELLGDRKLSTRELIQDYLAIKAKI